MCKNNKWNDDDDDGIHGENVVACLERSSWFVL